MPHNTPDPPLAAYVRPSQAPSCPICGLPLTGNQTVCSAKCRMERSRRKQAAKLAERDAKVRLLLRTARESLEAAEWLFKASRDYGCIFTLLLTHLRLI